MTAPILAAVTDADPAVANPTDSTPDPKSVEATTDDDAKADSGEDTTDWKAAAEKAQADLEKWRKQSRKNEDTAKANKTNADKQSDALAKVAAALGLDVGPKADPQQVADQLTKERDKAATEARQGAVQLAVYKAASKLSANPDALLDSVTFVKSLADLDPSSDEFADELNTAIKATLKANPAFGTKPPAPDRSGGEIPGDPNASAKRPTSLSGAINSAYRT